MVSVADSSLPAVGSGPQRIPSLARLPLRTEPELSDSFPARFRVPRSSEAETLAEELLEYEVHVPPDVTAAVRSDSSLGLGDAKFYDPAQLEHCER